MKAIIDRENCISCGLCEATCPEVFKMDEEDKAIVIVETIPAEFEESAKQAAEECPVDVISVE